MAAEPGSFPRFYLQIRDYAKDDLRSTPERERFVRISNRLC
jgi:hypothetical protein